MVRYDKPMFLLYAFIIVGICTNIINELRFEYLQRQIDELKSVKFQFERGTLNLTADIAYNQTIKQWRFRWPNNNCVCPDGMIFDNEIWYDSDVKNCNCTIYFKDSFVDKPKLLFNSYFTDHLGSGSSAPSILADWIIYYGDDRSIVRYYHKDMIVENDRIFIVFHNTRNLWLFVDWYAFGYIRK